MEEATGVDQSPTRIEQRTAAPALNSRAPRFTPHALRRFLLAWQFLTVIPLGGRHEAAPWELARSMAWYPVVGLLLGALLAGADLLLSTVLARGVVDVLLVLLLVAVTGGLHQDGLADSLDGLAGGRTPAARLAIMRDGRIGAIGATGLILDLGLRYAGLEALPPAARLPVLLCLPAVGRMAMVIGAASAPYARPEGGLAAPFLSHLSRREVAWAALMAAGALLGLLGTAGAVGGLLVAVLAGRLISRLSTKLCGGVTGDVLGATNETAEVAFLLVEPLLLAIR